MITTIYRFVNEGLIKFISDILFAVFLLIFLSPLILLIILILFFFSSEKIFYFQKRIGMNGSFFTLIKFRTMSSDPEILNTYFDRNPKERRLWIEKQKLFHDPRITKIGNFLREFSLDELPQILNVLIGQMSFIGPRPIVVSEIAKYGSNFKLYKTIRPGISGLWQVSGRNNTTYKERVDFDIFYVENRNFLLDFKIFFKTFSAVFSRYGAY